VHDEPGVYVITRLVNGAFAPLELNRSNLSLDVRQRIQIEGERPQWLAYSYRLQEGPEKHDWLVRWESHPPRPESPYPRHHLHVNAQRADRELGSLHLATHRLPLEVIAWTLISDFGVEPLDAHWQRILEESISGYDERQH
jgi:hypothetical protein